MQVLGAALFGLGVFSIVITFRLRDYGPNKLPGAFLDRWSTTLRILGVVLLAVAIPIAILSSR